MKRVFLLLTIFLSFSVSGTAYAKTTVEDLLLYEPDVQEISVNYADKSIEVNDRDTTLKRELGISNTATATQIKNALKDAGYAEISKEGKEVVYRSRFENKRLIAKGNPVSDSIDKAVFNGWSILQFETVEETMDAYETLMAEGVIVFPDEPIRIVANESAFGENAGAVELGLDKMRDMGTEDVTVAVLDTGFTQSAYFGDRVLTPLNFSQEADTTDTWEDGSGHGTKVASVIVDATGDHVKVLPMKVTGADGSGVQLSMISAFEHIFAEKDADVINLSVGWQCSSTDSAAEKTFWTEVIEKAVNKYHIPVVVASGNKGTKDTCYPANLDIVWAVGSLGTDGDNNTVSVFSNYGNIDFVARGYQIPVVGTDGETKTASGTSFSAPLIAAMAAGYKTKYHYATCDVLYDIMKSTCEDLGEEGYDEYYGWGRPVYSDGTGNPCPDGCSFVEESRKASTCISEGVIYSRCVRCGNTKEDPVAINPDAHTGYKFSVVSATCTSPSYKVKKCKGCKVEISRTEIGPALGHHYDSQNDLEELSPDRSEIITYQIRHCDQCGETFQTEISRKPNKEQSETVSSEEATTETPAYEEATTEKTTEVGKITNVSLKKPKISSLRNKSKKKLRIVCGKQPGLKYLYQYSTSKKFKKASKKKSGSYKVTVPVKKGKKYYVRVRTYKVINGKVVQSPWSKVKSIKIKK